MTTDRPKAIIFDMDDTILSDDEAAEKCWRQTCDSFGSRIKGATNDVLLAMIMEIRRFYWTDFEFIRLIGLNLRDARLEILTTAFSRLSIEDAPLANEMTDSFMALKSATVELVPGVLDTLAQLRREGVRLALITNGPAQEQRKKIKYARLEPLFESILIEGEFGIGKPDPRVFHHTLERLNVQPEETWMVGDNLVGDVGGAQAVGIYGVWVDWRGSGLPEDSTVTPDHTIRSIVELVN